MQRNKIAFFRGKVQGVTAKTGLTFSFLLVFVIAVLGLNGCAYTTQGFMWAGETIDIIPVMNKVNITSEQRIYNNYTSFPVLFEKKLTNVLISKFNTNGRLKVVAGAKDALKLTCVITKYWKDGLRYTDVDDIKEQKLRMVVKATLTGKQAEVLRESEITGEAAYYLCGPNSKTEAAAQADLIDDTARRILEFVVDAW